MGTQWSGMRNLKPVEPATRAVGLGDVTIQSNGSRIVDKLKREIGELTEE